MLLGPLLFLVFAQPGFSQPIITVNDALFKGDKNARVSLVEFADYQCPFCARFYRETFPQIEENYIFTGKVKFFFRNFPLNVATRRHLRLRWQRIVPENRGNSGRCITGCLPTKRNSALKICCNTQRCSH